MAVGADHVGRKGIVISAGNSVGQKSATTLSTSEEWTGTWEQVLEFQDITISLYGLPANSEGTLWFEFSYDGATAQVSVPVTVDDPATFPPYPLRTVAPYFRARYVNGTDAALTEFRLVTLYHRSTPNDLTRTPAQTITDSEPVKVTRAILTGKNPTGVYQNVELSSTGAILVATESEASLTQRHGFNADVDTGTTPEDIWAAGGERTVQTAGGQLSVSSDSVADTSAGTGARTIQVTYLDTSYDEQTETMTMNGLVAVTSTATDILRIQDVRVMTAGAGGENAGTITGTISAANQFQIPVGENSTKLSHYTVPNGKQAKFIAFDISQNGGTSDSDIEFQCRKTDTGLWEAFHVIQLDGNASTVHSEVLNAPIFPAQTDIRVQVTSVSANNMAFAVNYTLNISDA